MTVTVLCDHDWCVTICDCDMSLTLTFFSPQQFITWYTMADHGSYFITMYKRSKLTWELKQRKGKGRKEYKGLIEKKYQKKKEKKGKNKENETKSKDSQLTVYECKSIWISYQEHDEIAQWISSWVPVPIKSRTLMKNVSSWLNRIITTRAFEILIRNKSQMVFINWSMISDGPCSTSTK